jgi:hypothetical protein
MNKEISWRTRGGVYCVVLMEISCPRTECWPGHARQWEHLGAQCMWLNRDLTTNPCSSSRFTTDRFSCRVGAPLNASAHDSRSARACASFPQKGSSNEPVGTSLGSISAFNTRLSKCVLHLQTLLIVLPSVLIKTTRRGQLQSERKGLRTVPKLKTVKRGQLDLRWKYWLNSKTS